MRPDRRRPGWLASLVAAIVLAGLGTVSSWAQPAAAPAAKVLPNPWVFDADMPTVLRLDGDIGPGSAQFFEAALAEHPGITTLVLQGEGTSQVETMLIARRVHDLGLSTRIEAGAYCHLACGIVFLAGPQRRAEGILCVAVLYADTVNLEKAQQDLADFVELVTSFGLSTDLLSSVVETAAGGYYCFSPHEIARFGVDAPVLDAPEGWNANPYAVLYEQPAEDAPNGAAWPSFTAVAHWSLEEGADGPLIQLVAEVPELDVTVTVTVAADPPVADRDNRGTLVTVRAETPADFHGDSISNLLALLSRANEATAGIGGFYDTQPTARAEEFTVHITDDLAWPFARVHFSRRWLSFVLEFETGQLAELLIEVGEEGRAVIDQAYTAWDAMAPIVPARPTKD